MNGDELIGYFGFGSLVNRNTLRTEFVGAVPARLNGWRRHWQARTGALGQKNIALLSIHRARDCSINGMLVVDRMANLPLVDEREAGYDRIAVDVSQLEILGAAEPGFQSLEIPGQVFVYVARECNDVPDTGPLLQSYLDAVLQGFRNEFGDQGVSHFIESTSGFERAMITDRNAPLYPRSVMLDEAEKALFDKGLQDAGVRFS